MNKESCVSTLKNRTHLCNDLRITDENKTVTLMGWVHSWRDHGGVVFIDLRDYTGLTQIVFNPEISPESHKIADTLRSEFVIAIEGVVAKRSDENINPKISTGEIEVKVNKVKILNKSLTPPFEIDEHVNVGEDHRLKYRYIDLRRKIIQKNIINRHFLVQDLRTFLNDKKFFEIETPILNKSTPEGARDYLVPSRINPGNFYALPQSPQIFKQILMVSGFDKYYQIAKCFRDEDLRKDRQPEFTQLDMELSFESEENLMKLIDEMFSVVLKKRYNIDIPTPIKKIPYDEAIRKYGSDRPDLRFDLELSDVSDIAPESDFQVFKNVLAKKGIVWGINAKAGAKFSRKEIDDLTDFVGIYGAKGLAWAKIKDGKMESVIGKFFSDAVQKKILERMKAEEGDLILFVADKKKVVIEALGNLRVKLAEMLGLINEDEYKFAWVVDFPLFQWDDVNDRWAAVHHPFTAPKEEDIENLMTGKIPYEQLGELKSASYDLVLNGIELGGGSIRIHSSELQSKILEILKIPKEEANEKFGFLLEALQYGAPPHGGIAFGLDRIMMLMENTASIRDVIAFPKTQKATCLLSEAPSGVSSVQLDELHLKILDD